MALDLEENLLTGDEWFNNFKRSVDDYVRKTGIDVPEQRGSAEPPLSPNGISPSILELDLKAAGISSIVWATGFDYDYHWVKLPILDDRGEPVHDRGVTQFPGIYLLGLRWLYRNRSGFLSLGGPAEDAAYLAEQIMARS